MKHKRSGGLYAMKAIMKRHVLAHQELAHTLVRAIVCLLNESILAYLATLR